MRADAPPSRSTLSTMTRLGGWLFKHRTWLPLPIALALIVIPSGSPVGSAPAGAASLLFTTPPMWLGVPIVGVGEALRLWAVHHIGVISRTRSDRLGPLVDTGPFSVVRNPLYVGNVLLWVGFAVSAQLVWMVPVVVGLLAFEYHAIVRWEESLLLARIGDSYRDYIRRVPRWIPALRAPSALHQAARFSWGETFFSERGTLIAIAAGYLLLWLKGGA
jgi:protein-S-isoprenylcysteine O-methyltransferase Ste14